MSQPPYGPSDQSPQGNIPPGYGYPSQPGGQGNVPSAYSSPYYPPTQGAPAQMPPPYGQPGYGPAGGSYSPPPLSNGIAIGGLVLGISALFLALFPIIGVASIFLGATGLILGGLGLRRAQRGATGKGVAISALIVSGFATLLAIGSTVFYTSLLFNAADDANQAMEDWSQISPTPDMPTPDISSPSTTTQDISDQITVVFGKPTVNDDGLFSRVDLDVTITNTSDAEAQCSLSVGATTPDGEVILSEVIFINQLQPNESQASKGFTTLIDPDQAKKLEDATFYVGNVLCI